MTNNNNSSSNISDIDLSPKVQSLLPEAEKEYQKDKRLLMFVLQEWENVPEDEIPHIAQQLKNKLTEKKPLKNKLTDKKPWWQSPQVLKSFLLIFGILLIALGLWRITRDEEIPLPGIPQLTTDCKNQEIPCLTLLEVVTIRNDILNINKLTVKLTQNQTPDDRITIRSQGRNSGQIGILEDKILYSGDEIGTVSGGIGETPLEITFNPSISRELAQQIMTNIVYENTADNPTTGIRKIEFRVADDKAESKPLIIDVNVIPKSEDLTINIPSAQNAKENEPLPITGISIDASETQRLTLVLQVNNGKLTIKNNISGGLTAQEIQQNKTQKVVINSTVRKINTTLTDPSGMVYQPNKNYSGQDSLNINLNIDNINTAKGLLYWSVDAQKFEPINKTFAIAVKSTNPEPSITIPVQNLQTNQNDFLLISGINISDPNNQNVTVTLEVNSGKITVKPDVVDGLSADNIQSNGTNKVTLKGNLNQINDTLADASGVTYTDDKYGNRELVITANDGKTPVSQTLNINVNDIPLLTRPEFVMTSYGSVTKPEAISLIKSWLQAKSSVMARPYDTNTLAIYTTGSYYQERLGALDWLRRNNGYYSFGEPSVEASGRFETQGEQVIIDVRVYQTNVLRLNGRIDRTQSRPINGVFRYTLSFDNSRWKIANSKRLR